MNKLTLLLIGSGGREHALAWALARSPRVGQIYVAPGNAGTEWPADAQIAAATNVALSADDAAALLAFARERQIDLTVVGPEAPLAAGVVDLFQAAGLPIFGPSRAAARLEASKSFAKDFMRACAIPTGGYATFADYEAARRYLAGTGPVVVKADGLAAGKGVLMCDDEAAAQAALHQVMLAR